MKSLERFSGGDPTFRAKLNALIDRVNALGDLRGDGIIQVHQNPHGQRTVGISIPQLQPRISHLEGGFWAKILGNAAMPGPTNRWKYAWEEVAKVKVGYPAVAGTVDNWLALTGGRSGTTGVDPAYNTIENMNNAVNAHVEGNGVDPANLDTAEYTFAIMPCTTDNIVWMREVRFTVGATTYTEYWFSYENGVDGTCD